MRIHSRYRGQSGFSLIEVMIAVIVLATGLLIKLADKDKAGSKRGAYYYQLNMQNYYAKFQAFMNFIPNPDTL